MALYSILRCLLFSVDCSEAILWHTRLSLLFAVASYHLPFVFKSTRVVDAGQLAFCYVCNGWWGGLSLGNLSTQYAWAFVGLSVTEVITASITVVIGLSVVC